MLDRQIESLIEVDGFSPEEAKLEAYKRSQKLASDGIRRALVNCEEMSNEKHEVSLNAYKFCKVFNQ